MKKLEHRFVEFIPDILEKGVIYISMEYSIATHSCACGCGNEVVTPLSPTDWKLEIEVDSISLYPSIGNWSFNCKSHYWITNNKIKWSYTWDEKQIEEGRLNDKFNKAEYFEEVDVLDKVEIPANQKLRFFKYLIKLWKRLF